MSSAFCRTHFCSEKNLKKICGIGESQVETEIKDMVFNSVKSYVENGYK